MFQSRRVKSRGLDVVFRHIDKKGVTGYDTEVVVAANLLLDWGLAVKGCPRTRFAFYAATRVRRVALCVLATQS